MKKLIILLLCGICIVQAQGRESFIANRIAQLPADQFESIEALRLKPQTDYTQIQSFLRRFDVFQSNSGEMQRILQGSFNQIKMPVFIHGQWQNLLLTRNLQMGDDIVYTHQDRRGERIPFAYQSGRYYHGIIENDPHSLVAISFFDNEIMGIISSKGKEFTLGRTIPADENCTELILYSNEDLLTPYPASCGTSELPVRNKSLETQVVPETFTTNCVKFYIECDNKVYTDFASNLTNATNYATGLMNNVSTLYLNDSVYTAVAQINVWTSADPYLSAADTYDALLLFSTEMDNNGFTGDLAHLFSKRSLGGGIAWLNVLCDVDYYRCGVSASLNTTITPLPTYSWNSEVITHEMGHNIASPHTHACAWNGNNTRIDNCGGNAGYPEGNCNSNPANPAGGGTIMSYCHLQAVGIDLSLGFGPQPGSLIRNSVNGAACLSPCPTCPGSIVITGNYGTALTESSTTITSSGQTTIASTSSVILDADPNTGYILLAPGSTSDFVVAAPSNTTGVFIAQTFDGCLAGAPAKPASSNFYEEAAAMDNGWRIYPNPSDGALNFEYAITQIDGLEIRLLSMEGRSLFTEKVESFSGKYRINIQNIPTGVYLLQWHYQDQKHVQTIHIR